MYIYNMIFKNIYILVLAAIDILNLMTAVLVVLDDIYKYVIYDVLYNTRIV